MFCTDSRSPSAVGPQRHVAPRAPASSRLRYRFAPYPIAALGRSSFVGCDLVRRVGLRPKEPDQEPERCAVDLEFCA